MHYLGWSVKSEPDLGEVANLLRSRIKYRMVYLMTTKDISRYAGLNRSSRYLEKLETGQSLLGNKLAG